MLPFFKTFFPSTEFLVSFPLPIFRLVLYICQPATDIWGSRENHQWAQKPTGWSLWTRHCEDIRERSFKDVYVFNLYCLIFVIFLYLTLNFKAKMLNHCLDQNIHKSYKSRQIVKIMVNIFYMFFFLVPTVHVMVNSVNNKKIKKCKSTSFCSLTWQTKTCRYKNICLIFSFVLFCLDLPSQPKTREEFLICKLLCNCV